ncbi:MAG: tRNA guanosine(34) transglycosylase Tgt [Candidatus Zambryskibacteria bacterium]|nr:tRNA guanosine(34) transglycosylase Tgt [Candidatus Zambryskibacteria bacterium]
MKPILFKIEKKLEGKLGRTGVLSTPHGDIQTPAFVTVGTKATVKALTPEMVKDLGAQVVLANTYHLYLEPGDGIVRDAGGIQKFMNWKGPTMTDSGGFQVFSLGAAYGNGLGKILKRGKEELALPVLNEEMSRKAIIDPNGVMFRSHIDGSSHYFTPEKSIEIQHNLGADMIFAFDECTSPHESDHYQGEALDRTHRWAKRSLEYHKSKPNKDTQGLFGIVQGGRSEKLRKESAEFLGTLDFDGYGIGGSFEKEDMNKAVEWCNSVLPEDKPRHLLGIGEPMDLFGAVENGCDLFDCVAPTRMGRNGGVHTRDGKINLGNAEYRTDFTPIDAECGCYTCKNYTKAYLAHLFRSKEMLAGTLASVHNLYFIIHMVDTMREAIGNDTFFEYKEEFLKRYYRK